MNQFSVLVSDLLWLLERGPQEPFHHVLHAAVHGGKHVSKHVVPLPGGVVHLGGDARVVAQDGLDAAVLDTDLVVDHVVDLVEQVGQALGHPGHVRHPTQSDGEAAVAKVEDGAGPGGLALHPASIGARRGLGIVVAQVAVWEKKARFRIVSI